MSFTLHAHAKVNLTLEALAKRDDGYHEVATVLQTISPADTLTFEAGEALRFTCSDPGLQSDDNLVVRAARLLREATGCEDGASIHLVKAIPAASGLGSGATDAAAALIGLDRLWGLDLPPERLLDLAAALGSDVPFFLGGGTAVARGRGEIVTPLPAASMMWMVLLHPPIEPIPDKTAKLYSLLNPADFSSGETTARLAERLKMAEPLGGDLGSNVFERVAFDFFPKLAACSEAFTEAGAADVHLAGAGPALFALVPDRARGEEIVTGLQAQGLKGTVVHTISASPLPSGGDDPC